MTRPIALLAALALALSVTATSHAGVVVKAPVVKAAVAPPDAPCNFDHRLDVVIKEGVWFECSCEALMVATVCDWYEITSPAHDPQALRKFRKNTLKVTRVKGGLLYTPRVRLAVH